MILDTSAVIAILRGEPEAATFSRAIAQAFGAGAGVSISTATYLECALVAGEARAAMLDELLQDPVEVVPFTPEHLALARRAHVRFGRGSDSPARLNFGDCMSYSLAMAAGEPLLYKGEDFSRTDLVPALPAPVEDRKEL